MSLLGGDLTTPERVATWMASAPPLPSSVLAQLVTSQSRVVNSALNRGFLYSRQVVSKFDSLGMMQLLLPQYPVTSVISVQCGNTLIQPAPQAIIGETAGVNYGYRFIPWGGNLPGDPAMLEFAGGFFYGGPQNIKVTYVAGYLVQNEAQVVPSSAPYVITMNQFAGIWCRDNGVAYAESGAPLTPVTTLTGTAGQYLVGPDSTPGVYTFNAADAGSALLASYSFIPADLEEAVIQQVVERYNYRSRVGDISKSLGGQETVRWARGGMARGPWANSNTGLPPEIMQMIWPYVSVIPPEIGAPV